MCIDSPVTPWNVLVQNSWGRGLRQEEGETPNLKSLPGEWDEHLEPLRQSSGLAWLPEHPLTLGPASVPGPVLAEVWSGQLHSGPAYLIIFSPRFTTCLNPIVLVLIFLNSFNISKLLRPRWVCTPRGQHGGMRETPFSSLCFDRKSSWPLLVFNFNLLCNISALSVPVRSVWRKEIWKRLSYPTPGLCEPQPDVSGDLFLYSFSAGPKGLQVGHAP